MKNVIILVILMFGFTFTAIGQNEPSEAVKKVFNQTFAGAKSVKWDKESANEWEAEFTLNGKEMTAAYDNNGKWLETETEISEKELPSKVAATLDKEFQGYKKGEIVIVESAEMKGFEIGLKKGTTSTEVVIDSNGKVLKNTPVKKEDEISEKD